MNYMFTDGEVDKHQGEGGRMTQYYTEFPRGSLQAENDEEALKKTKAKVIYKESDTKDGIPFIMVRDLATE